MHGETREERPVVPPMSLYMARGGVFEASWQKSQGCKGGGAGRRGALVGARTGITFRFSCW